MADIEAFDTLTPAQHNAISALLTEPSVRKAAEVAGVKERTLYAWLRQPDFATEYRTVRREATGQAIALIQKFSGAAAAALCKLAMSGKSEAVRLTAASKILDLALKSTEIEDLRAELEALKAMLARDIA